MAWLNDSRAPRAQHEIQPSSRRDIALMKSKKIGKTDQRRELPDEVIELCVRAIRALANIAGNLHSLRKSD
jgi:hypothetical protein